MKTKYIAALVAVLFAFAPSAHAAKSPAEKFSAAMSGLDDLIKDADIPTFAPSLAPILKTEAIPLGKALLDQKVRFSEVVVANIVAEKSRKTLEEVIQANLGADWFKVLEAAKVPVDEALGLIEEIHTDVAFAIMDQPKKKSKKK